MEGKFWGGASSSDDESDSDDADVDRDLGDYRLPNADVAHWAEVEQVLAVPLETPFSLGKAIARLRSSAEPSASIVLGLDGGALEAAVAEVEAQLGEPQFFETVLPELQQMALRLCELFPDGLLPRLPVGSDTVVRVTRTQARCVLAHAFFCTLRRSVWSDAQSLLSFHELYSAPATDRVAVSRLKCLLCYFHQTHGLDLEGEICIRRHRAHAVPDWGSLDSPLCQASVTKDARIEDAPTDRIVDFANANLHIGRVIASCTQEEVLFSIRPELFLAMIVCQQMDDDESVLVSGAQQFSDYSGYLHAFEFAGPAVHGLAQEVVAMDALATVGNMEFMPEQLLRDVGKAYAGFSAPRLTVPGGSHTPSVSSGNWGCGVFGGTPLLKFLLQLLALSAASSACTSPEASSLHYSTFGDAALAEQLTELHAQMIAARSTVAEVWQILLRYDGYCDFSKYFADSVQASRSL